MSTNKLLQTLSEDPQLEKQIGCMAGILQLFDRHQVLTGRRLYGHKRIATSATSNPSSTCGSPGSEENGCNHVHLRLVEDAHKQSPDPLAASRSNSSIDKKVLTTPPSTTDNTTRTVQDCREHPRAPLDVKGFTPSPRKLDSSRSLHEGRVFHEGKVIARRSVDTADRARVALTHKSSTMASDGTTWSPLEIRDTVTPFQTQPAKIAPWRKDVTKESCKMVASDASNAPWLPSTTKELSSPRSEIKTHKDAGSPKEEDVFGLRGKDSSKLPSRNQADLNESLRLLAKLREAPWNFVEGRDVARNSVAELKEGGARYGFSKEGPRNSYDGREPPRASSVEYKEFKSAQKMIKDSPRLSLDGRLASSEANGKVMDKAAGRFERKLAILNSKSTTPNCDYEALQEGIKRSSPNVVARLMGLEEMPIPNVGEESRLESHKRIMIEGRVQHHFPLSKSIVNQSLSTGDRRSVPGNYGFPTCKSESDSYSACKSEPDPYFGSCFHSDNSTNVPYSSDKDMFAQTANGRAKIEPDYSLASVFRDQPPATRFSMVERSYLSQGHQIPEPLASVSDVRIPIEELIPSSDFSFKEVERRLKALGLQGSNQEMQALKLVLDSLQAKDRSLTPRTEDHQQTYNRTRTQQHTSVKYDSLIYNNSHHQDVGNVEWRSKKLQEQEAITPYDTRPSTCDNRAPSKVYQQSGVGFQSAPPIDAFNFPLAKPVARFGRSRSLDRAPQSSSSRCNDASPRKASVARKTNKPRSPQGFNNIETASARKIEKNAKCNSPSRSSGTQQSNPSSSRASGMPISSGRGQSFAAKSNGQKVMKKSESGKKKNQVAGCVVKDREESRANLVSLKSQSRVSVVRNSSSQSDRKAQNLKARSMSNAAMQMHKAPGNGSGASKLEINEDRSIASAALPSKVSERLHENIDHAINPTNARQLGRSGVVSTEVGELPFWGAQQRIQTSLRAVTSSQIDNELQCSKQQNEDIDCQAEKSTGNSEQPSPVSVLDSSFYQEDRSPIASAKCALKFEELDVGTYDDEIRFTWEACKGVEESTSNDIGNDSIVPNLEGESIKTEEEDLEEQLEEEYVREILAASALAGLSPEVAKSSNTGEEFSPLAAELFEVLERKCSKGRPWKHCFGGGQWRRRWLFDSVNVSVKGRLRRWVVGQQQPWVLHSLGPQAWSNVLTPQHVWEEIQHKVDCEEVDLHVQEWGDDVDMVVEKGDIAMHVERLIFKDLVHQTLRDLLS